MWAEVWGLAALPLLPAEVALGNSMLSGFLFLRFEVTFGNGKLFKTPGRKVSFGTTRN